MKNIHNACFCILGFAFFVFLPHSTAKGNDVYLVMFESPLCEWCEQWHQEIGGIYSNTGEGCLAKLRRINIKDDRPKDLQNIANIHYTPTFVLLDGGKEVSRIVGYPGEDFFWGLLNQSLEKITISEEDKEKCL